MKKRTSFYRKICILFYVTLVVLFSSCGRNNIEDIRNCIILKQHCGFDNLDAGFYQVKDLKTGVVKRINVDIRDCDVYNVGDTIR